MNSRRYAQRRGTDSAALAILIALTSVGCVATPSQTPTTEPPPQGEPLPGAFHLTSNPPLAPYAMTIRINYVGGPSGRSAEFKEGEAIVIDWSTLPLPLEKRININGSDCDGAFEVQSRFETDLGLTLTDKTCRIQVLGMHPEGAIDHQSSE